MARDVTLPEFEGTAREWWDKAKVMLKGRSALVRLTVGAYALCLPKRVTHEEKDHLTRLWAQVVGRGGPRLIVLSDTVFVPDMEEEVTE